MSYEKAIERFAEMLDNEFGHKDADFFEYRTAREWGIIALSCAFEKVSEVVDEDLEAAEGESFF